VGLHNTGESLNPGMESSADIGGHRWASAVELRFEGGFSGLLTAEGAKDRRLCAGIMGPAPSRGIRPSESAGDRRKLTRNREAAKETEDMGATIAEFPVGCSDGIQRLRIHRLFATSRLRAPFHSEPFRSGRGQDPVVRISAVSSER